MDHKTPHSLIYGFVIHCLQHVSSQGRTVGGRVSYSSFFPPLVEVVLYIFSLSYCLMRLGCKVSNCANSKAHQQESVSMKQSQH